MKIYIVHTDAWDDGRAFDEIPNEEIEKMYEENCMYIDMYRSVDELCHDWNIDELFYPYTSYMRVIND